MVIDMTAKRPFRVGICAVMDQGTGPEEARGQLWGEKESSKS